MFASIRLSFRTRFAVPALVLLPASAAASVGPVGAQLQVNSVTSLSQTRADVAVALDGEAVVVWQSATTVDGGSDTSGTSIQAQRLSAAGTPVGSQFQVNTFTSSDQTVPAVAMSIDGRFLVVWQGLGDADGPGIRGRFYAANGSPASAEFPVNDLETGSQHEPDAAALVGGGFVVAWQSFGSTGGDSTLGSIQARRFTSAGTPVAPQTQVNTAAPGNQLSANVAVDWRTGRWGVAWRSFLGAGTGSQANSVRAQRFLPTGATLGGELLARTTAEVDSIEDPALSFDRDGSLPVAWNTLATSVDLDPFGLEAQRFDADGAIDGPLRPVVDLTGNDQRGVVLAALSRGGHFAAWSTEDAAGDDPTRAIDGIVLDAEGVASSSEFQVNTFVHNAQEIAAVAVSPGGMGWVVWESNGSSGTDISLLSIQGQRIVDDAPALIFYDGFGSGSTSGWSNATP